MFSIEILVVLAPAIAIAVAGFFIEAVPPMRQAYRSFMLSAERVEWLREVLSHASFYGGVLAAILGYQSESLLKGFVVATWFLVLLAAAFSLTHRLEDLRGAEEDERRRAMHDSVRQALRAELDRTESPVNGGQGALETLPGHRYTSE